MAFHSRIFYYMVCFASYLIWFERIQYRLDRLVSWAISISLSVSRSFSPERLRSFHYIFVSTIYVLVLRNIYVLVIARAYIFPWIRRIYIKATVTNKKKNSTNDCCISIWIAKVLNFDSWNEWNKHLTVIINLLFLVTITIQSTTKCQWSRKTLIDMNEDMKTLNDKLRINVILVARLLVIREKCTLHCTTSSIGEIIRDKIKREKKNKKS